jgi:hypothetical protein
MFSILFIALLIISAGAQDHEAHHPDQDKAVQSDNNSSSGTSKSGIVGKQDWCVNEKQVDMMKMMDDNRMMVLHPIFHTIYHLSDMKDELNLSDKQIDRLLNIKTDFQKRDANWQSLIEKNQIDLEFKVGNNASVEDVKKYFQAISVTKIELQSFAYESAQKMLSVLDTKQKEKWQRLSADKSCCTGSEHSNMSKMMKMN